MKKHKLVYISLVLFFMGVTFGCTPHQDTQGLEESGETQNPIQGQETEMDSFSQELINAFEQQRRENQKTFYEEAKRQGIDKQIAENYFEVLMEDNLFQDGAMALTGIRIDDIDGNGQMDMLVMVLDAKEMPFYGSGGLWFYMNDDKPYCFSQEDCSYYGWFDAFWDDIDNDGNVEIVFSAQGTGCGGVGDSYKAVFKYIGASADSSKHDCIRQMQLPSDFADNYDFGIYVDVIQEPETDSYTAYCSYFDEMISFEAHNVEDWSLPKTAEVVGGEVRGFYNLCVAEYEGKKALQASEYLSGEGGVAHGVATAQFLITWKEDGTPEVVKWWIESEYEYTAKSR